MFNPNTIVLAGLLISQAGGLRAEEGKTPTEHKIRIVLVGDSTVTDRSGWGLGFKQFLTDRAECINTAQGGRSSMSFMQEGRWTNALALKGDYYLIQFGHNNEPGKPGRSTDMPTFIKDMSRYVEEARALGARPVLVTPLTRRQWDKAGSGKIKSSLTPYAEEVKRLAADKKVPLVDLHRRSIELCEQMGREECYTFSPLAGTNGIDNTHLNAKGSVLFARLVVEELVRAVPELKPCFRDEAQPAGIAPLDTSGFGDSRHHWLHIRDSGRFIQALPGQPEYRPDQVREIAANILLFQRDNGGWPKDYDMLAILTPEQKGSVLATRSREDTSFDNGNLHSQVSYLAHAFAVAKVPEWRDACIRGFDFILAVQYPNGGFPQRYPHPKDFRAHITFNDYVMIGCLNMLQDAAEKAPHFAWLDEARRERAREAVRRGVDCILKCQISVNGALTGWCQQHDEKTFEARPGRTFELASICPQDTTLILRFLMRLKEPGEPVIRAVDAAAAWLKRVELFGVRVARVKAEPAAFERHDADFDVILEPDAQSTPLWARHYEIGTDRPIFAGRDGIKRYALADIERERRTGTPWYGTWPKALLDGEYAQWRARVAPGESASKTR